MFRSYDTHHIRAMDAIQSIIASSEGDGNVNKTLILTIHAQDSPTMRRNILPYDKNIASRPFYK